MDAKSTDASSPELKSSFDELAGMVFSEMTLDTVLEMVIALAVGVVPSANAGSVTLMGAGPPHTRASTSDQARAVDLVQYENDRGPCLSAIRERRVVTGNLSEASDWPEVAFAARQFGIESVLSLPLGEAFGALNLYGARDGFGKDDIAIGQQFARQSVAVVANATSFARAELVNQHLQDALVTRDTIGQAKGVLRERHGYDDQAAFDELRRRSQQHRRKLREVAEDVIASAPLRRTSE